MAAARLGEGAEKILEQLGLEIAHLAGGEFPVADAKGAAGEIERGGGEAIVHGHEKIAGAEDAALRAERALDGFAERDAGVLDGVVLVHVEIAADGEIEIEGAVAGDLLEHVIEETNAGGDAGFSAAVEIEAQADIGFLGFAAQRGFSHNCFLNSRSRRRVCAGVPRVMRT